MLQSEALNAQALQFPGLNHEGLEGTVLATIINRRVADFKNEHSPCQKRDVPLVSLYEALKGPERHFILECKCSSPTLGSINESLDEDAFASVYSRYADAISVLCEPVFFGGSLERLHYIKQKTNLPVICKDFIIDEQQIDNAYAAGADAVLLMCSVLKFDRLLKLYEYATALGLEAIVETATQEEARFAIGHGFKIAGINNRDLKTLKVDFQTSFDLEFLLDDQKRAVISESGVKSRADVLKLYPFHNFLVGSALCKEQNPLRAVKALTLGYNKVCGINSLEALQAVVKSDAIMAGFIFAPASPRYIRPELAQDIIRQTKAQESLYTVGVFKDQSLDEVIDIASGLCFDYVQLHGKEDVPFILALKEALGGVKIIKALNIEDLSSFEAYETYAPHCDFILFDSKAPGSGLSFDWTKIPHGIDKGRCLLSGGLNLSNLKEAMALGFAGYDINSGVEARKGQKDPNLIKAALAAMNTKEIF